MVEAPGSNAMAQHFSPPGFLIKMKGDVTDDNIEHDIDHDKGKENSEVHPLQLPPSSQFLSSSHLAEDDYHLKSSIPSNVSFLLGSALFLELSRIYLIKASHFDNTNDEDDDYDDDYDWDSYYEFYYNHYKDLYLPFVSIFGGLFMILNAMWEIYWCFGREREWREEINAGYASDDEEENEAYHREERQNLSSALAFGTAACIGFGNNFIKNEEIVPIVEIVSSNMYLLSAMLALRGTVLSCPSLPTGLALVGDILFALGSVIDVAISLISDPEISRLNDYILAQWDCVSSTLWLIDALLYFAADMTVVWYRYKLNREEGESASGDIQHGFDTDKSLT
eukprot:CAMPEP_0198252846 /NCGR_PEP_ID=MMETSP1447-20131203/3296_1 /TAXON_ID=420782 /ORGANISM="Chaetoceros dichaeta, Strain CCMP1751" /LENGTH=337 /DNA_ID=CAMNT_0043938237 /DNA_START=17 /DNA_END=1030 /DNA_ORIENTATION=+